MQPTDAGRKRRILVVDDEPALRTLCQRLVWNLGHECEVAEDSAAASELVGVGWFDVILCDYLLRGETARTVVDAIAAVAPAMVGQVVITSGATTDPEVVALAERYGLTLMSKPYGSEDLARVIGQVPGGGTGD